MATPKEHVEQIRLRKFLIGGEENPLTQDLYNAVKHLSSELYTKDIHFIMELIQNAEDNEYPPNVEPSLEFVITSRDITCTGARGTLVVFNNEKGFSKDNIESLCSVGQSTKRGNRQGGGYIGEKGIGFKSVFLVTSQPYIFSNGYKIKFNEAPTPGTKIGYIVPEWVDDKPSIADLKQVYGGIAELPNTVIVLPLRPEKIFAVERQVSNIHPEVILFMSKIKRLSVRGDNAQLNRVNTVSVSLETAFQTVKNRESESFILHLAAEENEEWNGQCSYYMWRQRFPVWAETRVEERKDIKTWVITLAFPCEERVTRPNNLERRRVTNSNRVGAGIYAFLPTQIVTGFPFIIQADFLLVSSRESIIWDNNWNKGILNCIPSAFCTAFRWLLQSVGTAPVSSRTSCFRYLPIDKPSIHQLRRVRNAISSKLKSESVILCQNQEGYCKPSEALNILPGFRNILEKATEKPSSLQSNRVFIVHSCMDNLNALNFLGVKNANDEWYAQCIQSSNWVVGLSDDLYVQLIWFLADYWERGIPASPEYFPQEKISNKLQCFPLFKFDNHPNGVRWASLSDISNGCRIYFSSEAYDFEWLTRWNSEFVDGDVANYKFIPNATQKSINALEKSNWLQLREWLSQYPVIADLSVSSFTKQLIKEAQVSTSCKFVVRVTQFLHYSKENQYLNIREICDLHIVMPIVDDSGSIVMNPPPEHVFVPLSIGRWAKLMRSKPWVAQGYVTLSSKYMEPPPCALGLKGENDLELFIKDELGAMDIPQLRPPNAALCAAYYHLNKNKALLLLEWIENLTELPEVFRTSIAQGKWLRTHRGYQSPCKSFLLSSEWESAGLQLSDLPFIDNSFNEKAMDAFKNALKKLGVVIKPNEVCDVISKQLEMHTDLEVITRIYKYLYHFKWKPSNGTSVKIWILRCTTVGRWEDAKMCVVHDDKGQFCMRNLNILDKFYESALLPFFSSYLGVSLHPKIEDYCDLWQSWTLRNHQVSESECCCIWRNILKHWSNASSKIKLSLGYPIRLPVYTSSGRIKLCSLNETFVPDDLQLKELFKRASNTIKFAWHPNPSDPKIPLDFLFSIYNTLGAPNISQAIQKNEITVTDNVSLRKLPAGEGLFRKGLYRIVLGYMSFPSFKISADKRHQKVMTLFECCVYESIEPFTVEYSLSILTEVGKTQNIEVTKNIIARENVPMRWEKETKRILMQKSDPNNPEEKVSLAIEFAKLISNGLLPDHPGLIAELCEIVKLGCVLGFDDEAVNCILETKNFQLFMEDEDFLVSIFPKHK